MKAVTLSSVVRPMRIPVFQSGWRTGFDSESIAYSVSLASMNNPAHAAELIKRVEKIALLIEDLDAMVPPVGDEKAPTRVEGESVGCAELAGRRADPSPLLDVSPVLRELYDASG